MSQRDTMVASTRTRTSSGPTSGRGLQDLHTPMGREANRFHRHSLALIFSVLMTWPQWSCCCFIS